MANERFPNDPYRSGLSDDNFGRPQRFDNDMQIDPELREGPASSSRMGGRRPSTSVRHVKGREPQPRVRLDFSRIIVVLFPD